MGARPRIFTSPRGAGLPLTLPCEAVIISINGAIYLTRWDYASQCPAIPASSSCPLEQIKDRLKWNDVVSHYDLTTLED